MFDWKNFRRANKLTQSQLADLLGCTNSNISMAEKSNRDLEPHQLEILIEHFGDSLNSFISENTEDIYPYINKVAEEPTIPLVPLSAMAGKLTGFSLDGITETDCEKIISPIKGVDFAVPVSGESMSPIYPNGSRVLVQEIDPNSFIEWGKVYVLNTCNGIIIKQLRKSEKEGYVSCYSYNDNNIYAPFDIATSDVYGWYKVLMCLSLQ